VVKYQQSLGIMMYGSHQDVQVEQYGKDLSKQYILGCLRTKGTMKPFISKTIQKSATVQHEIQIHGIDWLAKAAECQFVAHPLILPKYQS
jgi:hypothetical protein